MIDIEKLRGHLGNLWAQTSMSDIGSKSKLDEALTELERLQKRDEDVRSKLIKRIKLNEEIINKNINDKETVNDLMVQNGTLEFVLMLMGDEEE